MAASQVPLFPKHSWGHISESAQDLICGMLRRNPGRRISAKEALAHPWLSEALGKQDQ